MNKFIFWSAVGIVVAVGSYVIIRCLKTVENIDQEACIKRHEDSRREMGFHAIAKDHISLAA